MVWWEFIPGKPSFLNLCGNCRKIEKNILNQGIHFS